MVIAYRTKGSLAADAPDLGTYPKIVGEAMRVGEV